MRRLLVLSFLLCLGFPAGIVSGSPAPLVYLISTDKETYILGESVKVTFSWENLTSKDLKIESWLTGPIEVFFENQQTRIPFKGIIGDGIPGWRVARSRQKLEQSYIINNFIAPEYAFDRPGEYRITSTYVSRYYQKRKNFWIGEIAAPDVSFKVRTLGETELDQYRTKIPSGDSQAIQIVAAHRDTASIQPLVILTDSHDVAIRQMAYRALANIGTDESIRALAEAVTREPLPAEKTNILMSFKELRNPVVIPYVRTMLKDEYVGGYTTTRGPGGRLVRYRVYLVRKWAYLLLKELGVDIPTVYEEEIKQL